MLEVPETLIHKAMNAAKIRSKSRSVTLAVKNLIATIEHFLGHLDIPLKHKFAVEGISTEDDLKNNPSILEKTAAFSEEVCSEICKCR